MYGCGRVGTVSGGEGVSETHCRNPLIPYRKGRHGGGRIDGLCRSLCQGVRLARRSERCEQHSSSVSRCMRMAASAALRLRCAFSRTQ